ncbi:hypothetical protein PVAP13_8KG295100 [Panicum virgatum]|uniref:Uncharacterized protein n=1 Tax=Panicum virgatum TaxID=38727 RepID=A0A8T0PKK3_PANVG|nr:hypothetical protein PVAP13_8KG295100 [Panicum virgatum]
MAERASSSASWVVEMEKLLEDSRPSVEMARWKQCYIYQVPEFIKKMTKRAAYQPQFVSLGPLHHGKRHLLPMEEHKRRAMLHMVNSTGKPLTEFVAAIEEVADELEAAYEDLDDRWRGVNREINNMVRSILNVPLFEEGVEKLGLHILDIFHKQYYGTTPHWEGSDKYEPRTPSAVELSEAGIQFIKNNTRSIHDVDFENGVLSMPLFTFHDQTEVELLNLMAFEWLHPDAKYDVRSYITFMDNIIRSERDVALLRSQGIITNHMRSDKKVVELLSIATKLGNANIDHRLGHVQGKMNSYCRNTIAIALARNRRNEWFTILVNNYLEQVF